MERKDKAELICRVINARLYSATLNPQEISPIIRACWLEVLDRWENLCLQTIEEDGSVFPPVASRNTVVRDQSLLETVRFYAPISSLSRKQRHYKDYLYTRG
ncbi:hypothetical protein M1563_02215 [Patescibacteria group bacterium]|nr:hypothetical protein [Patescibacteria group bacterium]